MTTYDEPEYLVIAPPAPKKIAKPKALILETWEAPPLPRPVPAPAVVAELKPRRRKPEPPPEDVVVTTEDVLTMASPVLSLLADTVSDLERVRIAVGNRLGTMTRTEPDEDGVLRGWGLPLTHPNVVTLSGLLTGMSDLEKDAVHDLQREMRKHPLWNGFAKNIRGVGEKQFARLLGAIGGDPYLNNSIMAPRTVGQLWAYCGLHVVQVPKPAEKTSDDRPESDTQGSAVVGGSEGDADVSRKPGVTEESQEMISVAPRRRRGVKANWSGDAKTRAYLIAASILKQLVKPCSAETGHVEDCKCSAYRVLYDLRREHTRITHPEWTPGHAHNDALRYVSKRLLRNAWRAARDWHYVQEGKEPLREVD
jgi:hypothetical protein